MTGMNNYAIGIAALWAGIIALGLAVIPGIALERPFPFAAQQRQEPPAADRGPEGGLTVKFNKFSVTFGGDEKNEEEQEAERERQRLQDERAAAHRQRVEERDRLLKWFTIAAASCSLVGLILSSISWVREDQHRVAGSAAALSCVALLWQYVVLGIVAGIAICIVLVFLSRLAS